MNKTNQNVCRALLLFLMAMVAAASDSFAATVRLWDGSHASSGNWTTAANWSGGVAPVAGDILSFPPDGLRKTSSTNNFAAGTTFSTINVFGTGWRLRGNSVTISNYVTAGNPAGTNQIDLDLTAAGPGVGITLQSFSSSARLTLTGDINLNGRNLTTDGPADFILSGVISGAGNLIKNNTGDLTLSGSAGNTYTGTTFVNAGILRLGKALFLLPGPIISPRTAIPGDLVIGSGTGGLIGDIVVLNYNNQIADASDVTINGSGELALSGNSDTIGSLTMTGGHLYTQDGLTIGTLTLGGDVRINAGTSDSVADGRLNLGSGAPRIFNVFQGAELRVNAEVAGGAGISLVKSNRGTMYLASSNTFSGDVEIVGGMLSISHGRALGDTSGVTMLKLGTLAIAGTIGIPEALMVPGPAGTLQLSLGSSSWLGSVTLDDDLTLLIPGSTTLSVVGQISGPAGWTKFGNGTLQFKTPYTNDYAGTSWVREGNFIMDGVMNQPVIPGPFVIGNATDPTNSTRAWMIKNHQIANAAPVTINRSGVLQLFGFDDTVGPLMFNGGAVETDDGILKLNGDILVNATNEVARILGEIALGGVTRTIYTLGSSNTPDLHISAVISDGGPAAGFNKVGEGSLRVSGANTFSGPVSVTDGDLRVANPDALGSSAAGTSVTGIDGGKIILEASVGMTIAAESLTLNSTGPSSPVVLENFTGNNHWNGPITLLAPESVINVPSIPRPLSLGGVISGPGGIKKIGVGTLTLDGPGANVFAGATTVCEGSLLLSKPNGIAAIPGNLIIGDGLGGAKADLVRLLSQNQIGDLGEVTMANSGWLDCNNRSEGLGSLAGQGLVTMGGGFLDLGSNNLSRVFSGVLSNAPGANGMSKIGSGTQTFSGNNLFTGAMSIDGGVLLVNGSQPLTFMAVRGGGTLGGGGTVAGINVQPGGRVSPGSSPGILSAVQGVGFAAGGILQIELNGLSAGTSYDQFRLLNSIQLGNAVLQVTLGFAPSAGDTFTIVNKESAGAVGGTFQGLPEGAVFSAGGVNFRITYAGGDGNDVVLTQVQVPASTLSSIRPVGSERMQITGQGVPFVTYILEFTPHLNAPISWAPIATNTANSLGIYEFIDAYADGGMNLYPTRFYRVQSP